MVTNLPTPPPSARGSAHRLLCNWPGPLVLAGSWLGLISALMTAALLVLLPFAWRGSRAAGVGGWTVWRKLRHTAGVLSFAALSGMLLYWGALQPWAA